MIHHDNYFNAAAGQLELPYLIKNRAKTPTCLNLCSGLPDPDLLPFKEATFTLKSGQVLHFPQHQMDVAFQYSVPQGIPELIQQLRAMITKVLAPPHMAQRGLLMTASANFAIYTILHTFVDRGDYVFLPEATYPGFLAALKTTEAKPVPVPIDRYGLRPDLLRTALKNCSTGRCKLLYVVPHADNPTGITMSEHRLREIYSLACEYDILIVEDDPYYFLQYGTQIPSSFLSLDTEGRVLRIDTFSKTVGAGMRLGYVTADAAFIDKVEILQSTIMGSAPTLSQVVTSELLRCLGHEGFLQLTKHQAQMYKQKRDVAIQAATKHLSGLCEWKEPDGMFLWLKVLGVEDTLEMVHKQCIARELVLASGIGFMWEGDARPSPCIRVSFSLITPEKIDTGFGILADVIKEELKNTRISEKGMKSLSV